MLPKMQDDGAQQLSSLPHTAWESVDFSGLILEPTGE